MVGSLSEHFPPFFVILPMPQVFEQSLFLFFLPDETAVLLLLPERHSLLVGGGRRGKNNAPNIIVGVRESKCIFAAVPDAPDASDASDASDAAAEAGTSC